jgi:WD40 repeat protein/serine/threonine protein kinase
MRACPPEERLEQLLEDRLGEPDRTEVSSHVASCPSCQQTLERLSAPPDALRQRLSSTSATARSTTAAFLSRMQSATAPTTGGRAPTAPAELPQVAGYELEQELGRGGMGVVYRARHLRLNRTVALKMILSGAHAGEREIARFLQEAEAVAQLHHPNIVQIYDVGESDGHPFIALELVEGGSLVQHLRGVPPPTDTAARLVEVLARAVHFAHERGIVHRDLKPANVLLQADFTALDAESAEKKPALSSSALSALSAVNLSPKITDFGLAKRLDGRANATITGEVMGTPSYMAPEQASGAARRVGPVADVYALGAILYEMLTSHPPFKAATPLETVLQVMWEEPVRPSRLRPEVPRDLETICLKCLEKTPGRRYATALALADDLRRFRHGEPVVARPVGPQERLWKLIRRRPASSALAAGMVVVTLLAFVIVTWWAREAAHSRDEAMEANNQARIALYQSTIAQSQLRWRLNDFSGAQASLYRFRLASDTDDPRNWEWAYLQGLYAADLLTVRHEEGGGSSGGLAVSQDGRWLATVLAGQDRLYVWAAADGQQAFPLPVSPGAHRVSFRPDGAQLAVAHDGGNITIWDLDTHQRTEYTAHRNTIVGLDYSPDGKWLATAGWDGTVRVQEAATGKLRFAPLPHNDRAHCVAFSPCGRWLATGDQGGTRDEGGLVRIWNAATGDLVYTMLGHKSAVYGVAFSPNGSRVASAGSNGNVRLWDGLPHKDGKPAAHSGPPRVMQSLTGNAGAALSVAFSPDGRYLAYGASDATARVYHVMSGVERVVFRGHTRPVEAVRFSSDGRRLYSCCPEQGEAKAWDLTRHPEYSTLGMTRHPEYPKNSKGPFWPEVKVWNLLPGSAGPAQERTGPDVEALAFQDEGRRLVSVAVGGRLQTWDTVSGMLLEERILPLTKELISPAHLADFSPDGRRLAARRDLKEEDGRVVGIWDVATGEVLVELKGHRYPVFAVRFSGDGRYLATFACNRQAKGRPHEVVIWDAQTGGRLGGWEANGHLFSLAFSPDGSRLALGAEEGAVKVVEWATGKTVFDWPRHHKGAVTALAFSGDGRRLASAGEGGRTVKVWDTVKQRLVKAEATGMLCALVFSPDGKRLAGVTREVVKLWDVQTGQELLTLRGAPQRHRDPSFNPRLAFSPDGKRLVGSNWDESISLWEAEAPSEERQQARREAALRRAPLWHLQEAEHCDLINDKTDKEFHLRLIGEEELPGPLQDRKDHLLRKGRP